MDIAVQRCGDSNAVFRLALINDFSPSEQIIPGQEMELPEAMEPGIVKFFSDNSLVPATEETAAEQPLRGIGYSRIGIDFKVG